MASESAIQFMKPRGRQPVPLIGREQELSALKERLMREDVHLLSLIGAAGVGKTRLAQAAMNQMRHLFLQTIWVDLAPISDPAQVLPTIAHSCGVQDGLPGILHQRLT